MHYVSKNPVGHCRTNLEVDDGHITPATVAKHIESVDSELVSMKQLKVINEQWPNDRVKQFLVAPVGLWALVVLHFVAHQFAVPACLDRRLGGGVKMSVNSI